MFTFLFLFFSMLLLCSFFQIITIISREKWCNYVVTFFFLWKMPKNWVGRTTVNGEKKRGWPKRFTLPAAFL